MTPQPVLVLGQATQAPRLRPPRTSGTKPKGPDGSTLFLDWEQAQALNRDPPRERGSEDFFCIFFILLEKLYM